MSLRPLSAQNCIHAFLILKYINCKGKSEKPAVPNPRVVNRYRYWSVGHFVPGLTQRINNLQYIT